VQVLICPECQTDPSWTDDLDRCASCGSTMLVRVLGETRCRACSSVMTTPRRAATPSGDAGVAADVDAALRRRFGSYPDRTVP